MPEDHSQPIESILIRSADSCFRASMTMSTQYNLNIPRNIPAARAVQAKPTQFHGKQATTTEQDHKLVFKASQNQGLQSGLLKKALSLGMEHVIL